MIKRFFIKWVLKDIYSYLQNFSNIYEASLYGMDCSECSDEECSYCNKVEENITNINIVFSWLTDYEYSRGLKS